MLASKPIIVGYNQKVPEGKPSFLFVNAAGEQSTVGEVVEPSAGHTRIVVVGCTHGKHEEVCWPHGDILIHTGDIQGPTSYNTPHHTLVNEVKKEWENFTEFMMKVKKQCGYKWIFVIGGNHDWYPSVFPLEVKRMMWDSTKRNCPGEGGVFYIQDELFLIPDLKSVDGEAYDLLLYASPISFIRNWHSHFFQIHREGGEDKKIKCLNPHAPLDTSFFSDSFVNSSTPVDLLITHGPPFGIGDCGNPHRGNEVVGSKPLREYVSELKPKFHFFADWHGPTEPGYPNSGCGYHQIGATGFVNSAVCVNGDKGVKIVVRAPVIIDYVPTPSASKKVKVGAYKEWRSTVKEMQEYKTEVQADIRLRYEAKCESDCPLWNEPGHLRDTCSFAWNAHLTEVEKVIHAPCHMGEKGDVTPEIPYFETTKEAPKEQIKVMSPEDKRALRESRFGKVEQIDYDYASSRVSIDRKKLSYDRGNDRRQDRDRFRDQNRDEDRYESYRPRDRDYDAHKRGDGARDIDRDDRRGGRKYEARYRDNWYDRNDRKRQSQDPDDTETAEKRRKREERFTR